MVDAPTLTKPSSKKSGSTAPTGTSAPSRSRRLLAYCEVVSRCMRATGWSPLGVAVVVGMLLGPASEPAIGSGPTVWPPPAPAGPRDSGASGRCQRSHHDADDGDGRASRPVQ